MKQSNADMRIFGGVLGPEAELRKGPDPMRNYLRSGRGAL
jgi:hypothetical protein